MIGILGGKFGLYAWLPAILEKSFRRVVIESRHLEEFNKRPELQKYIDQIVWVRNVNNVIDVSDILILAIPPDEVFDYLGLIHNSNVKKIIVEKPICKTPGESEFFIKKLEQNGKKVCSSYLFIYTDWFTQLKEWINDSNEQNFITINWFFLADHFRSFKDTWKKQHSKGGGSLRFYGIHLIAVLAYFDYKCVKINFQENCFVAVFESNKKPDILIRLDSHTNDSYFSIESYKHTRLELDSPFSQYIGDSDTRIKPLKQLLSDFENNYEEVNLLMKKTNSLWKQVEEKLK